MARPITVYKDTLRSADARRTELLQTYRNEKLVPVYLSPMYRPYFGNVMRVMVNGISVWFKVDGTTQKVPQTFADEITARRIRVDQILTKKGRMANINANSESSPGEITLF